VDSSSAPSTYLCHLRFIWSHRRPFQRGSHNPSNPNRACKHPYDSFSINRGIGHLAVMIIFPTVLNDESGLSEMSVATWMISYDIGYMPSSTSRTLEHWKAINSATCTESNIFFQFWF
jgi:hypothetical protein